MQLTDDKASRLRQAPRGVGSLSQGRPLALMKSPCLEMHWVIQHEGLFIVCQFLRNNQAIHAACHQLGGHQKITTGQGDVQPMDCQPIKALQELVVMLTDIKALELTGRAIIM